MAQDKADHHTAHKDCREDEADDPAEGGGFGKWNHHNLPLLLGSPRSKSRPKRDDALGA